MRFYGAPVGACGQSSRTPDTDDSDTTDCGQPLRPATTPGGAGPDNKTPRKEHTNVTDRSLLAALIAGLILPPAANAQAPMEQASAGFAWNCRQDPRGSWICTTAPAPADTAAQPAQTFPAPAEPAPEAMPTPAAPAPASAPEAVAPPPPVPRKPVPEKPPAPAAPVPAAAAPPPDATPQAESAAPTPPEPAAPPKPAAPAPAAPLPRAQNAAETEDGYNPWALCDARPAPELPDTDLQDTELSADDAKILQGQTYVLTGNAVIDRAGRRVQAEHIRYDEAQGIVQADGAVRLDSATTSVTGSRATLQIDTDQGEIHDVEYTLHPQHARGQAAVARQESKTRKTFEQATYTTCDAGHEAWRLNARSVTLQEDEGFGTARHVWLELGDVPVLYTPYISFPIDDRRKSGFLVPSIGNSQNSGAEFAAPYYWNIAPHRDATITPRILAKRGAQVQGEFRYLNPTNHGELGVEYLPADSEFDDEDRSLFSINHSGNPMPRVSTLVRAANVSDDQYFEDLGSDLEMASTTHLQRLAQARYNGGGWALTGRVQDFQTVDPTASEPYTRLPQLLFDVEPHTLGHGVEFNLDSELVQFDHESLRTGTRIDMQPMLSLPQTGAAWFVTPAAGVRHTQYNLEDAAGLPSDPTRTLPVATLDSGLFFERQTALFGNGLLQTLEPRAFYLYVPHEDQSELPDFDTSLRDFSFQQMFEDNRFSGADRMGDANQLTLAATTRLLDPATGTQHASFSFGEILYFRDRDVTLPGQPADEQSSSSLVAELDLRLSRAWKTVAGVQWDPHETKTERSNIRLQYRPDPRHLWNFAYRYRSDELEQLDTSALWQITPRWHGVMRWNYSLPDSALLEALGGIEYESCCWILRVLGRSYISDTQGENNDAILLQLELKGLTSFGDPIESVLEDGILGYTRN